MPPGLCARERFVHVGRVVTLQQNEHARRRHIRQDRVSRLDSALTRHDDVHHHDVGLERASRDQGLPGGT
jgi:hypothetical protein